MNVARYLERSTLPNGLAPHWHHIAHVAPCGFLCRPLAQHPNPPSAHTGQRGVPCNTAGMKLNVLSCYPPGRGSFWAV